MPIFASKSAPPRSKPSQTQRNTTTAHTFEGSCNLHVPLFSTGYETPCPARIVNRRQRFFFDCFNFGARSGTLRSKTTMECSGPATCSTWNYRGSRFTWMIVLADRTVQHSAQVAEHRVRVSRRMGSGLSRGWDCTELRCVWCPARGYIPQLTRHSVWRNPI